MSLYAIDKKDGKNIFALGQEKDAVALSEKPFLGVIQINFVHYEYKMKLTTENILLACEEKIIKSLGVNGMLGVGSMDYQMFRSSTSGDFCLVVKSADVQEIYKISTLINNLIINYQREEFKFNTYTNIGIECRMGAGDDFLTFSEGIIKRNEKCEFALRLTTNYTFAKRLCRKIEDHKEPIITIEPMEGLFGRYDFLLQLSMRDFSQIYTTLCVSKIIGNRGGGISHADDGEATFLQLLKKGIAENEIKIINERVLVPLSESMFVFKNANGAYFIENKCKKWEKKKDDLQVLVDEEWTGLRGKMDSFQEMDKIFMEERRAFIDTGRELWEVIRTYMPQGREHDSHVNWRILNNDLKILFDNIDKWKEMYEAIQDSESRKMERVHFLEDLRLATEAINQYYKFLQNVNAQTWQAPLYEIQTQLDAEKMMVAYREFLYEYFCKYKAVYEESDDKRPMLYPIVYPDMSVDYACVMVPFQNVAKSGIQFLVCRVPSFEYYGRMFDMVPWILHEASHSIRVLGRKERNGYLLRKVFQSVFSQAMYKLLNQYSNDYGYYGLGILESDILDSIVESAVSMFLKFCEDRGNGFCQIGLNLLETEIQEFFGNIFSQDVLYIENERGVSDIKHIQYALLDLLGRLNLLDGKVPLGKGRELDAVEMVKECAKSADMFSCLLKAIYDAYYERMTGDKPDVSEADFLRKTVRGFEVDLENNLKKLGTLGISEEYQRDYCFTMRELGRLYGVWRKCKKVDCDKKLRDDLWKGCILDIRKQIEKGFAQNKGFTELYRILHVVFGNGSLQDDDEAKRIGESFDKLQKNTAYELCEREVTIYRETCADLFMAAALGLNEFGYCRQMFQTVSDASMQNYTKREISVNVRRFRSVAAVLLGEQNTAKEKNGEMYISMDLLLEKGKEYCHASLRCMKEALTKKKEGIISSFNGLPKWEVLNWLFARLHENIDEIFKYFKQEESVEEAVEDSLFSVFFETSAETGTDTAEKAARKKDQRERYLKVQEELRDYNYIIYRIKCFILLLDLLGENGEIIVEKGEYSHLQEVYLEHSKMCDDMNRNKVYQAVSDYYNRPSSAFGKSAEEMLDDTICFIQSYYYKNRFRIMTLE